MKRFHIFLSIGIILLLILAYSLFGVFGAVWLSLIGGSLEDQPFLADTLGCVLMVLFYGYIFYRGLKKGNRKEGLLKPSAKIYGAATVMALGVGGISYCWLSFVEKALQNIPFIQQSTERFEAVGDSMGQEPYIVIFLSVVIIGPLVEELLFRGLVFREAEKIRKGLFPVFVSAVLFGLFHMEFVQVVYTMVMGFVFGLVYQMTRSFMLVWYLHILNNFMAAPPPVLDNEAFASLSNFLQIALILPAVYLVFRWIMIDRKSRRLHQEHP